MNDSDPMRVLLMAFDSEELCVRLASALVEEVAEVCLMVPEDGAAPHLHLLDPRVDFRAFRKPRLRQSARQISTIGRLIREVRRFDPDVIHFQKAHLWFFLALPLLRNYPLVISIHDPTRHLGDRGAHKTPQAVLRFGYRRATRVVAHNEEMRRQIIERLKIEGGRVHIVPLIERGAASGPRVEEEDEDTVLFFGRIWPYKGLEYLVRAQPLVSARRPTARFVIAGRGEDLGRYRQKMASPDRFTIINEFVSFEARDELFARASVVVLPYVEATQSGVIPVAYTHGKPVVATAVGGLPSQVDEGRTGYLVPPRDERALADRIVELLENRALRRWMGENGRRKALDEWSAGAVARATVPVYLEAIRAAGRAARVSGSVRRGLE